MAESSLVTNSLYHKPEVSDNDLGALGIVIHETERLISPVKNMSEQKPGDESLELAREVLTTCGNKLRQVEQQPSKEAASLDNTQGFNSKPAL